MMLKSDKLTYIKKATKSTKKNKISHSIQHDFMSKKDISISDFNLIIQKNNQKEKKTTAKKIVFKTISSSAEKNKLLIYFTEFFLVGFLFSIIVYLMFDKIMSIENFSYFLILTKNLQ